MLYFSCFLHFYQPPTQFPEVTKKIAKESYEKILKILQTHKKARLTVNFSASLTEQLAKIGRLEVVSGFAKLAKEGRVELTGSAAYHPLLPKIPKKEIERQIKLNEEINKKYFGDAWPRSVGGFFPPEMAYSKEVGEVVEKLGYKWIILDESAVLLKRSDLRGGRTSQGIYRKKSSDLAVFIRNRDLSLKIAFSGITSVSQLLDYFDRESYGLDGNGYIIVALDGETFGHHQPGQLRFLSEILEFPIKFVTISELLKLFPKRVEIEPETSSWGESWKRWDNPDNPIHQLQWRLFKLALKIGIEDEHLDRALHSDQFWWASHDPCWHPKMIESGARMLQEVILLSPVSPEKEKEEAKLLYNRIILTGRKLYGEEIIPC